MRALKVEVHPPHPVEAVSATLTQLGYIAECERDPQFGLRKALEQGPSAIVLDLIMPELNGFELLERLRADPKGRAVPVIVWTSKDLTGDELAALRAAASGVVSKGHDGNARVVAELAALLPARPRAAG